MIGDHKPLSDYMAAYRAIARRLQGVPRWDDLPAWVRVGISRHGLNMSGAAKACGWRPNLRYGPRNALEPWETADPEEPEAIVVFEAPVSPHALTPEELAAERRASRERMRRRMAAEPPHRPWSGKFSNIHVGRKRKNIPNDYLPPPDLAESGRRGRRGIG